MEAKAIDALAGALTRRLALRGLTSAGLIAAVAAAPARLGAAQEALTEAEAQALSDRFVAAFNSGETGPFEGVLAADAPVHWFWPTPAKGPRHLATAVGIARTAFPDAAIAVDKLLVSENWVTALGTVSGTHTGAILGVPPTNRAFAIDLIVVARTVDGMVAEVWIQYDLVDLAVQLGALEDEAALLLQSLRGAATAGATPDGGRAVSLDDVVAIEGVVLAVEFAPDGSIVDSRSKAEMSEADVMQLAAAGPTLNLLLGAAAQQVSELGVLDLNPPTWVVYSGGEGWTVALAGNVAIVAETAAVDFNALYDVVNGAR